MSSKDSLQESITEISSYPSSTINNSLEFSVLTNLITGALESSTNHFDKITHLIVHLK
jgi:hypothetical protein